MLLSKLTFERKEKKQSQRDCAKVYPIVTDVNRRYKSCISVETTFRKNCIQNPKSMDNFVIINFDQIILEYYVSPFFLILPKIEYLNISDFSFIQLFTGLVNAQSLK